MRLIRFVLTILFISCIGTVSLRAQELYVAEAWKAMEPMTVEMQRKDAAGEVCALVKVVLPLSDVVFEGNIIGKPEFKTNEYWVYLTSGTKMLNVKAPGHYPLMLNFPDAGLGPLSSKAIYYVILKTDGVNSLQNTLANTQFDNGNISQPQSESHCDNLFRNAIKLSDFKYLADKGYEKAYAPLAQLYFEEKNFNEANLYARKALSYNIGKEQAISVIEKLDVIGYYDNGENGGKPEF